MSTNLNKYIKRKQRKRRFWTILLLTLSMAFTALIARDCSQSFDQPYNKDYQPFDQMQSNNARDSR